jgi:hypothetical protein
MKLVEDIYIAPYNKDKAVDVDSEEGEIKGVKKIYERRCFSTHSQTIAFSLEKEKDGHRRKTSNGTLNHSPRGTDPST